MTSSAILTFILVLAETSTASLPCCEGDNRIVNRHCMDGTPMTTLTCPNKYVIVKDGSLNVDEEGSLVIANSHISIDRYCWTSMNNSDVYIVCFSEADDAASDVLFYVHAILELISAIFLFVTVAVYINVLDLLDLQTTCIMHSITALAVSFIFLAANQLSTMALEKKLCIAFAYVIYFTMLYSFFWLNVLSFHIWRTLAKPKFFTNHRYWPLIYHLFGIGGPLLLLVGLIVASSMEYSDLHPGFGETKCWFRTNKSQFVYFYTPMAALLCLNVIYYGWTIAILWREFKKSDDRKVKVLKYRLLLCVKLFVIMGITWIFELLSAALQDVSPVLTVIWFITDVINTLQGILIFLILVVFRKRVVRSLASRTFCGLRLPSAWSEAADDECEESVEEMGLSEAQTPKN